MAVEVLPGVALNTPPRIYSFLINKTYILGSGVVVMRFGDIFFELELQEYSTMLTEDAKTDFLQKKFMVPAWEKHQSLGWHLAETPEELLQLLLSMDPTGTGLKYGQWICQFFIKNAGGGEAGISQSEDVQRIGDALTAFEQYKNRLAVKDINQYKTLNAISDVTDPLLDQATSKKAEKKEKKDAIYAQIEEVYDTPQVSIAIPKTMEASLFLGRGTKWCTAWADPARNMHNNYSKQGPLYVVLIKNEMDSQGRQLKYQIHYESHQFKQADDVEVKPEEAFNVVKKHPDIRKFFAPKTTIEDIIRSKSYFALSKWNGPQDFSPEERIQYAILGDLPSIRTFVNNPEFTPKMMFEVCRAKGQALQYLLDDTRLSSQMIAVALSNCPDMIKYVANDSRLDNNGMMAFSKALGKLHNLEVIASLVNNPKFTPDMMMEACKAKGNVLQYLVNDKRLTSPMIAEALSNAPDAIQFVAKDSRVDSNCLYATIKADTKKAKMLANNPNLPAKAMWYIAWRDRKWFSYFGKRKDIPKDLFHIAIMTDWIGEVEDCESPRDVKSIDYSKPPKVLILQNGDVMPDDKSNPKTFSIVPNNQFVGLIYDNYPSGKPGSNWSGSAHELYDAYLMPVAKTVALSSKKEVYDMLIQGGIDHNSIMIL